MKFCEAVRFCSNHHTMVNYIHKCIVLRNNPGNISLLLAFSVSARKQVRGTGFGYAYIIVYSRLVAYLDSYIYINAAIYVSN